MKVHTVSERRAYSTRSSAALLLLFAHSRVASRVAPRSPQPSAHVRVWAASRVGGLAVPVVPTASL